MDAGTTDVTADHDPASAGVVRVGSCGRERSRSGGEGMATLDRWGGATFLRAGDHTQTTSEHAGALRRPRSEDVCRSWPARVLGRLPG